MELYSAAFIGFVILSVIVHEIVGKKSEGRQWIVRLLASVVFYIAIAGWRIVFLAVSIFSVWYGGLLLDAIGDREEKVQAAKKKKKVAAALIVFNLGILAVTKYLLPVVSHPILLPLGISYYTLMAVSYVVDVYGQKYKYEQNPAKLSLYLIWFPQMLQGPINRYDHVSPTLYGTYHVAGDDIKSSALLFMFGAFKKYAIANVMIGTVGEIFGGDLSQKPGGFLFLGAFLYAICQYADFSGGIDMMVAVSRLFGVEMNINFRQPYFARSIAEFWRRWHITLGSFMKDYVFFPFALCKPVMRLSKKLGKKLSKHMTRSIVGGLANILIFFLVGLWHGPQIHFILWGLFNGVIIALSDMCTPLFSKMRTACHIDEKGKLWDTVRIIRTFVIICFAGYFDYIEKTKDSIIAFKNTFLHFGPALSRLWVIDLYDSGILSVQKVVVFTLSVIILFIVDILAENKKDTVRSYSKLPVIVRWPIAYVILILFLMSFTLVGNNAGFMYAAF